MFLVELGVNLSENLSSLLSLHLLTTLAHALEFLLKLRFLLTAVLAELCLLIIEAGLFINQTCDDHYLMFLDRASLNLRVDSLGFLVDDADLLVILFSFILELLQFTLDLLGN